MMRHFRFPNSLTLAPHEIQDVNTGMDPPSNTGCGINTDLTSPLGQGFKATMGDYGCNSFSSSTLPAHILKVKQKPMLAFCLAILKSLQILYLLD